jgi:beta-lactamase regulating signal transducer with metallopeptidase domain
MHNFKRFYLLSALVFALIIPSITVIDYVDTVASNLQILEHTVNYEINKALPQDTSTDKTTIGLWSMYILGFCVFLLKFSVNLSKIISKIKKNPKYKSEHFINVLVNNLMTPHTFFSYIFLDKNKFEHNDIPEEVLLHEQTHAIQKHSIDVIIIELFQIVFWFNPLIYFLKRDIKLNHEFLADRAVLNNGIQPAAYQTILLAFSSKASHYDLANAINYSSIKKRFTLMKTHTSKQTIWLRSLLLLPLIAITLYSFSERIEVEKEVSSNVVKIETIDLYLNEDGNLISEEKIITLDDIAAMYKQNDQLHVSIKCYPDANPELSKDLWLALRDIGIKKITICTSQVAEFQNSENGQATPEQLAEYNKLAKLYNNQPKDKRIVKRADLMRLESIYNVMSDSQKNSAEPFPDCPPPPPPPPPIDIEDVPPPPPPPIDIEDVPPPPPPQSPLDFIIDMAKTDAKFYYENKEITSDKAIELIKKNNKLNINAKNSSSRQPSVHISKDPITFKKN